MFSLLHSFATLHSNALYPIPKMAWSIPIFHAMVILRSDRIKCAPSPSFLLSQTSRNILECFQPKQIFGSFLANPQIFKSFPRFWKVLYRISVARQTILKKLTIPPQSNWMVWKRSFVLLKAKSILECIQPRNTVILKRNLLGFAKTGLFSAVHSITFKINRKGILHHMFPPISIQKMQKILHIAIARIVHGEMVLASPLGGHGLRWTWWLR